MKMNNIEFIDKEIERYKVIIFGVKTMLKEPHSTENTITFLENDLKEYEEKINYLQSIKNELEAWETIKEKQRQGIEQARLRGVHMGRPRKCLPNNFDEIARDYQLGKISNIEAREKLGMNKGVFFKYIKEKGYLRDNKVAPVRGGVR